jgi:serpin B
MRSVHDITSQFRESNNEFGLQLYKNMPEDSFLSPLSIELALLLVFLGSQGTTQQELAQVTGLYVVDDASVIKTLMGQLHKISSINVANSIWIDTKLNLKEDYKDSVINDLESCLNTLQGVEPINQWCSEQTNGMIPRILDSLERDMVIVLVNAIYFKGKWRTPFPKHNTMADTFYKTPLDSMKCSMMSVNLYDTLYLSTCNYQAVELHYQNDSLGAGVVAYVVLPSSHGTPVPNFDTIVAQMKRSSRKMDGHLEMPRFKVETSVNLAGTLAGMGIQRLFSRRAELDRMLKFMPPEGIMVSEVIHKVVIEVDEEGTVAAAATAVHVERGCCLDTREPIRFDMLCNRPFYFLLCEEYTGLILFVGKAVNPEAASATLKAKQGAKVLSIPLNLTPTLQPAPNDTESPTHLDSLSTASRSTTGNVEQAALFDAAVLKLDLASASIVRLCRDKEPVAPSKKYEIENLLTESFQEFRFANDSWLYHNGVPSCTAYYNMACVFSLAVQLQLLLSNEDSIKSMLATFGDLSVSSEVGSVLHVAPRLPLQSTTITLRQSIQHRLDACDRLLKVAVAAGWQDFSHLWMDRDLKVYLETMDTSWLPPPASITEHAISQMQSMEAKLHY